ncbi:TonB-dependent receptor [Solitalea lacus]|uniref:TonB-dependent receptor n=1 Tax=Solitalea lacus TaxID=2911172 RepID=UPI001EDB174E|nr:TonB-dependent receptor [Solitalea lacus]UKJ07488.1 TonB-dependent receptor [Solitalea lacus]
MKKKTTLLIMRVSVLVFGSIMTLGGAIFANSTNGQDLTKVKISLDLKSESMSESVERISKASQIDFTYNYNELKKYRVAAASFKNTSVSSVLDKMLANTEFDYKETGNSVTIFRKSEEELVKERREKEAQKIISIPVKGKVVDEKGLPLPGVSVSVKGSTNGVVTDVEGNFQVTVSSEKDVLVFSMVGFEQRVITVGNNQSFNIVLKESITSLNEVAVVGYSSKKVVELSSSVVTVSGEKLRDVTSNDIASLLQGKAPGVVASSDSGDPTSGSNIMIRGAGTITASSAPLVVVDGMIGGTYSPADVESITLLKDAAATGLYGSRASNGVLIITTKTGKAGKTKIDFNSSTGFAEATTGKFKLMNSQQLFDYQKLYYTPDPAALNANTNWWNEAFRTGMVNNYTLSASGGNEKTLFYISGNYFKEEGTLISNDKTAYNFRTNISHKLNDKLKLSALFNGIFTKDDYNTTGALYQAYNNMPFDAAYNANGEPIDSRYGTWFGRDRGNFTYDQQYNTSNARSQNLSVDLNLDYAITKHFSFATYNRVKFFNYQDSWFNDKRSQAGGASGGAMGNSASYTNNMITSNRLKYENTFGNHNLAFLAVGEAEKEYSDNLGFSGKTLPAGRPFASTAASQENPIYGSKYEFSFSKYLGQADYNYANKYFAVASLVREYGSRFGENNPWGTFYQLGSSWIISNESFMQDLKAINFLKLRASHGTTGNAYGIDLYASRGLYSISEEASYAGVPGAAPYQQANPDLTWEKARTNNIGLDLGLFKRIDLSIDAYDRLTSDLLFRIDLPGTSTYKHVYKNVGSVRNRGLEFNLTTKNFVKKFTWETNFNMAFNRNKVLALNEGRNEVYSGARQPIAIGHDMDEWYMPVWAGVNPANGDPLWEQISSDADGKNYLSYTNNYNLVATPTSRQFLGKSSAPKFTGGITNTFGYKGLTLSAFFNFVYGNYVYNASRFLFDNDGVYESYNAMVLANGWSRWQKPGDLATHPKPIHGGNRNANSSSSRYLEDGSYIRLRNITLGYQLPASLINKAKIGSARIFVSGDNLWTGTNFSGPDPEVILQGDIRDAYGNKLTGQSNIKYPVSKKIIFGINVGF